MATIRVRDQNGNVIDIPALRGKTAYQYALDGGYTGTEEEFKAKMAAEWATKEEVKALEEKGVTTARSNSLWAIIQKIAFTEVLTDEELNNFKTAWGITDSGKTEPDEPTEPDTPEVTLSSISASYTGGEVATGTPLIDLTGITVTANYSDGSTANVTGYTLSGTIAEGSNTITVSYSGQTATFTVIGIAESVEPDEPEVASVLDLTTATIDATAGTYNSVDGAQVLSSSLIKIGNNGGGKNASARIDDLGLESGNRYTLVTWCEDYNNCTTLTSLDQIQLKSSYVRVCSSSGTSVANGSCYTTKKIFVPFTADEGQYIFIVLSKDTIIDATSTATFGCYILEGEVTSI